MKHVEVTQKRWKGHAETLECADYVMWKNPCDARFSFSFYLSLFLFLSLSLSLSLSLTHSIVSARKHTTGSVQ